jgi:uncharacterized GH25 family protein
MLNQSSSSTWNISRRIYRFWYAGQIRIFYLGTVTVVLAFLLAGMFPMSASCHSLFIQSGRHQVSKGKSSPLFFCYGHHFPVDDAIRRKKFAYVRVIAPDKAITELSLRDEKSLHSYLVTYDQVGTYVLVAETTPGYFSMYYDKKGRKRHSLKPMQNFASKAKEIITSLRSSQWTKTYVFSGQPSESFPAQVGLPLELAPLTDVSKLKPGDALQLQVYQSGKPYEGTGYWDATYAGFSTEAEDMYIPRTSCDNGRFTVPVDSGGKWFVRFFSKVPAPEDKKAEYLTEKRTATIVFEVRNERIRPKIDGH